MTNDSTPHLMVSSALVDFRKIIIAVIVYYTALLSTHHNSRQGASLEL